MVPNTSELLPDPEPPVNTTRRRLGMSTSMCFRLFSRAPRTRMAAWLAAPCPAADRAPAPGAVLVVPPSRAEAPVPRVPVRHPRHRPDLASHQPPAVAHQLTTDQLVRLPPRLDAPRGDAEPAVRRAQRAGVEAGTGGEPV